MTRPPADTGSSSAQTSQSPALFAANQTSSTHNPTADQRAKANTPATTAEFLSLFNGDLDDMEDFVELGMKMQLLSPSQLREVIDQLLDQPGEKYKFSLLAQEYAKVNPEQAIDWYTSLEPQKRRFFSSGIAAGLAEKDTQVALQWTSSLSNNEDQGMALTAVLTNMAVEDPARALQTLNQYSDSQGLSSRLDGVIRKIFSQWSQVDVNAAAAAAMNNQQPQLRQAAIGAVASTWASKDPQAAASWIVGIENSAERANALNALATSLRNLEPHQALAVIDLMPPGNWRNNAINNIANNWAVSNPQEALTWTSTLENISLRKDATHRVLNQIARHDGQQAMQMLASLDLVETDNIQNSIFSNWMRTDSAAAMTWLQSQPAGSRKDDMLYSAVHTLSQQGVQSALGWAAEFSNPQKRVNYLTNLASQWINTDPSATMAWFQSVADTETRNAVAPSIASALSRFDPDGAISFLNQLPPDSEAAKNAYPNVVSTLAQYDIPQAANLVKKAPAGEAQNDSMERLIQRWTRSDPHSASVYLDQLPTGQARDAGIYSFTRILRDDDPEAAAIWAGTISDENSRVNAMRNVLYKWRQIDKSAATQFVMGQNLDDQQRQRLLEVIER